jgi:hypothetical protein
MATLSPQPLLQFFKNGIPNSGGKLYTYEAGTTNLLATWVNSSQTAYNTNPIILDSQGMCSVFLTSGLNYDYVIYDSDDVELYTQENISNSVASVGESSISTTSVVVGSGSKTLFIERNKQFVIGMVVQIAYTASAADGYMNGVITAYSPSTGELVVNVQTVYGSGTYADWTVSLSAPPPTLVVDIVTGTSSSSNTVGTGQKTFTTQINLGFAPGMTVQVANTPAASTNYMNGIVDSYNTSTGEFVFTALVYAGSGTLDAWTITLSAPVAETIPDASTTVKGKVQLATEAESVTATSEIIATTPKGVKAFVDSYSLDKGHGNINSLCFAMVYSTDMNHLHAGDTVAGAELRPSGLYWDVGSGGITRFYNVSAALAGTWRVLGDCAGHSTNIESASTLFQRIS